MWIERLSVSGFRRLSGTFEFSPTLTVVVGDNEAGKSSLHDALVRALFGFSRSERRRSGGSSLMERYAPWNGSPYGLVAVINTSQGALRAEWNFADHTVRLLDDLGRDISDRVRGAREDVALGEHLLGVGLDDFRQVCCIDQDELRAVAHSPTLGLALQEAVANVAGDTPVEAAVERLKDFLRTVVGARVDNLNPSPRGRLAQLGAEREKLERELGQKEDAREELQQITRERVRAEQDRDEAVRVRAAIAQSKVAADLREIEDRLREANRLTGIAESRPTDVGKLPEAAVDEVKALLAQVDDLESQTAAAERAEEAIASDVGRLEADERQLVAAVDGLAPYADVDTSARDEVQTCAAQLEAPVAGGIADVSPIPGRDPLLQRFRAERDDLLALVGAHTSSKWKKALWIALVVLTVGIAWCLRWVIRRLRKPSVDSLATRLATYGGASVVELDARARAEDQEVEVATRIAAAAADSERAEAARRGELGARIDAALDRVNAPRAERAERIRAYLTAVGRHGERLKHEAQLAKVQADLGRARGPVAELARLRREQARILAQLRGSYESLGITVENPTEARRTFDAMLHAANAARQAAGEAHAAATALGSLLAGATLEQVEAARDSAREALATHRAAHGDLSGVGTSADAGSDVADAALERVSALATRAEQLEEQVAGVPELKERLDEVTKRIERLNEAKAAVALARDVLNESADELRREFAPHLNRALEENLSRITGGRYREATVDADLVVRVVVPESGHLQRADELSRATRDQLFLVQRLEIARLLAPTKGTAPLLLDDPFARYDRPRLRLGLEVVGDAAEHRQIVLFSEDPAVGDLAAEFCGSCQVIRLTAPLLPNLSPNGAAA